MTVENPAEYVPFVHGVIASGTFHTEHEVLGEALRLLQRREHLRAEVLAGIEQLDRGEAALLDMEDAKARGRLRLAAWRSTASRRTVSR